MNDLQYALVTMAVAIFGGILVGWLNFRMERSYRVPDGADDWTEYDEEYEEHDGRRYAA